MTTGYIAFGQTEAGQEREAAYKQRLKDHGLKLHVRDRYQRCPLVLVGKGHRYSEGDTCFWCRHLLNDHGGMYRDLSARGELDWRHRFNSGPSTNRTRVSAIARTRPRKERKCRY